MLVLGGLVGLGVGEAAVTLYPALVASPGAFAVVGMAAFFAAVVRAPLTGLVLIIEMTGSYALMLPLLLACFCAYVVAESFGVAPLYEALLERDLGRRGILRPAAALVVEYEVRPGSPFAGRSLKDIGLPRGCVIVRVREGAVESVPQADTVLRAHQHVTAVIAPEAAGAHELLRAGVGLPVPPIDAPEL
jgi:CIC family chloride channel protein